MKKDIYIIAEIGINHNGDLAIANKLIDIAKLAGCDFVKFKKSQGFDVAVQIVSNDLTAQQIKDTMIMPFYEDNPMLEYVLLVGDVNGTFAIPTFTINSYNEEDIDVTDYPYTYTDNQYEPKFFLGRNLFPYFLGTKYTRKEFVPIFF